MKSEQYHFTQGRAELKFSFPIDEEILTNKKDFIVLLTKALETLNKEING